MQITKRLKVYKYFSFYREELKAKEKAILVQMMKDKKTSIDETDQTKKNESVIFKAKPVPEHVKRPLFRKMVQDHPSRYSNKLIS